LLAAVGFASAAEEEGLHSARFLHRNGTPEPVTPHRVAGDRQAGTRLTETTVCPDGAADNITLSANREAETIRYSA
jgi:hypothetical protein